MNDLLNTQTLYHNTCTYTLPVDMHSTKTEKDHPITIIEQTNLFI